jgi:hypothetical protein
VEWLSGGEPQQPAVLEERIVELLATVLILLRQHHINPRGQCRFCGATRWQWRFGHRRRRCTVYAALDYAMGQSADVLWWEVFEGSEQGVSLEEVRDWVEERRECETAGVVPDGSTDPAHGSSKDSDR